MFVIYYSVPPTFAEGEQVRALENVIESALEAMIDIISRRFTVLDWRRID